MNSRKTNTAVKQSQQRTVRNQPQNSSQKPVNRQQRPIQKGVSRSERQRRKNKNVLRKKISARVAFLLMTIVSAFLAVTIFFKVETISITATKHYSEQEIMQALELEKGDNMFTFSTSSLEKKILNRYPYLASVTIKRSLPSTVVVKAVDSVPAIAVNLSGGGYYLTDENGKMLEQASSIPKGVPSVTGVTIDEGKAGKYLDFKNNKKVENLISITKKLKEKNMLANVNFINVSALSDIRMGYLDRLDVRLGNASNLNEKFNMLKHIVENELSPSDVQTIYIEDASTVYCPPTTKEKIKESSLPIADTKSEND